MARVLAHILYFRILARVGATNLLLVTSFIPVSAVFFGILAFGESLTAEQAAGLALIGLGLAAVESNRNLPSPKSLTSFNFR